MNLSNVSRVKINYTHGHITIIDCTNVHIHPLQDTLRPEECFNQQGVLISGGLIHISRVFRVNRIQGVHYTTGLPPLSGNAWPAVLLEVG